MLVDDPALVDAMEKVREVVSGTLSLRKAAKIRVRQPLSKLTVVAGNVDAVKAHDELLKAELNIKNIEFSTLQDAAAHGLKIVHELRVNARAAGPRLGKQVQFAIKASSPATGMLMPRPVHRWSRDAVRRPCAGRRRVRADQPRGRGERHRGRRFGLRRAADRWLRDPRHRS